MPTDDLYYLSGPQASDYALQPPKTVTPSSFSITDAAKAVRDGVSSVSQAYYGAQGAVADASLLKYGTPGAQVYAANRGVLNNLPSLLLFGGLGVAALLLLSPGGSRRR